MCTAISRGGECPITLQSSSWSGLVNRKSGTTTTPPATRTPFTKNEGTVCSVGMMANPCSKCTAVPCHAECNRFTCRAWKNYYSHRQEYINAFAAEVGLLPEEFKKERPQAEEKKPGKQYWRYPHPHERDGKA